MVKEGYYFGLPLLLLGGAAYFAQWTAVAVVLVCLAIFVFSFFRDPERVIPKEAGAVVSPADGRVVVVTDEEDAGRPGKRISIFLAVWNVHEYADALPWPAKNMLMRFSIFLAVWNVHVNR